MATAISNGETSTRFARPAAAPTSLIASPAAVDVEVDTVTVGTSLSSPSASVTALTATVTGVEPIAAVTADGAITISATDKKYFITKAGVAAMTIVDPTATTHDGVTLTFVSTTAQAHTLSNAAGSGFFSSGGGTKDVATFSGAIGDGITIIAYQGKWYIDPRGTTGITLG